MGHDDRGAEWGGVWVGVSAPQLTRGSGERRELSQRGPSITFSAYFRSQNASGSKKNTILLQIPL